MITNINEFRRLNEDIRADFNNVGHDEDGNVIGCCKHCGANGVLVHEHTCKKNEAAKPNEDDNQKDLENLLYVGDFEI